MNTFYHISILNNYPIHHIYGDIEGYFILLGRSGKYSYTMTINEIKSGDWLYARLMNNPQTESFYMANNLNNLPKPFTFPSDIVFFKSENAICISRPIPANLSINDYANKILEHEPIEHFILASIMITLFVYRNQNVMKSQIIAGNNPRDFFSKKVDHLRWCLEQNRRIEEFGV